MAANISRSAALPGDRPGAGHGGGLIQARSTAALALPQPAVPAVPSRAACDSCRRTAMQARSCQYVNTAIMAGIATLYSAARVRPRAASTAAYASTPAAAGSVAGGYARAAITSFTLRPAAGSKQTWTTSGRLARTWPCCAVITWRGCAVPLHLPRAGLVRPKPVRPAGGAASRALRLRPARPHRRQRP